MPPHAPTTKGPLGAVPCPHCGKTNDFNEVKADNMLDTGETVSCDHCDRLMTIAGIQEITIVTVHPVPGRAQPAAPAAQPATTLGPQGLRRYLKR